MRSQGRKPSLAESRDLDGSYDQLTGLAALGLFPRPPAAFAPSHIPRWTVESPGETCVSAGTSWIPSASPTRSCLRRRQVGGSVKLEEPRQQAVGESPCGYHPFKDPLGFIANHGPVPVPMARPRSKGPD
ncbi:hypothetical protein KIL84_002739 [Mauremys mutica]|uniref:Uncharacterized protein n=1 Tax=Mauremys mutica TaxID=74926 RepID=A0A9D3WSQ6_9SAUR|nr:hypothetical protein KIL84_002739 [Mauremys mutica]